MVQRRAFRNGRRDDLVPNCSDDDGNLVLNCSDDDGNHDCNGDENLHQQDTHCANINVTMIQ